MIYVIVLPLMAVLFGAYVLYKDKKQGADFSIKRFFVETLLLSIPGFAYALMGFVMGFYSFLGIFLLVVIACGIIYCRQVWRISYRNHILSSKNRFGTIFVSIVTLIFLAFSMLSMAYALPELIIIPSLLLYLLVGLWNTIRISNYCKKLSARQTSVPAEYTGAP